MVKNILIMLAVIGGIAWFLHRQFPYVLSSGNNQQQIIPLALTGVIMGASLLLHYRGKSGDFIKDAVLWMTVILVLLIGYSYRDQLAANPVIAHMMGSIMPQRAIISDNGTMVYHAANDGHYYIETDINGVKVEFMADTGASDIALTKQDAARIGVDLSKLHYTKTYNSANGLVNAAPIILDSFTVGAITLHDVSATVSEGEMDKSLLGMSFFHQLHGFTIQGDSLTLTP